MVEIKLIIFDANGVLYRKNKFAYVEKLKEFFASHGISFEHATKEWEKLKNLAINGKIKYENAIKQWLEKLGKPSLFELWFKFEDEISLRVMRLFSGVPKTLQTLKQKYKLAVLSDDIRSVERKIKELKKLKIANYFDAIFTSNYLGTIKPNPEAYKKVLKHFKVKPREAVFVGHDFEEIEGAKKANMLTIGIKARNAHITINSIKELPKALEQLELLQEFS